MTLKQIKAMFRPGQKWHATRTDDGPHSDEVRTVHKAGTRDIVFRLEDGRLYYTAWPKASEVIEVSPGRLRWRYANTPAAVLLEAIPCQPSAPAYFGEWPED